MTYSPLLLVHIAGGIVGFLTGSAAMVSRKGSPIHRWSGKVFVIAMLAMASSGGFIALLKNDPGNVFAGIYTSYLVATAWLTVRRKAGEIGAAETALTAVILSAAAGALVIGAMRVAHPIHGKPAAPFFVFATIFLLTASGDVRMLLRHGISGTQRMVRHIWRTGFSLFIAAGSFFLGLPADPVMRRFGLRATLFTKEIRATHLPTVPVIAVVLLTFYWLVRIRLANRPAVARITSFQER